MELGFLSRTLNKNVALIYSGVKKNKGVVFEIDIGSIDCGAQLSDVSQYPGEDEMLFGRFQTWKQQPPAWKHLKVRML